MKTIQSIFFLLFMVGWTNVSSYAYPILQAHMSNRGILGYSTVEWHVEPVTNPFNGRPLGFGWVGDCSNPGFKRCRPPRSNSEIDATDDLMIDRLMTLAEAKWDTGIKSGQHTERVQVSGESFSRVYKISWTFDNHNEGNITIDRENL